MRGEPFNTGWGYRPWSSFFERGTSEAPALVPVTLPHDAMLAAGRDPEGDAGVAYFNAGAYQYEKRFRAPAEWRERCVRLRFEGVYRDAAVFLNGEFVAHRPFGYSELVAVLDDHLRVGHDNVLSVECRSGTDSRWYSGAGIYRDVTLFVAHPIHVALDGIHVVTPEHDDDWAPVDVRTTIENGTNRRATVVVVTEIVDPAGAVVATDTQPVTVAGGAAARARVRLLVERPQLWNVDAPALYECRVRVLQDGTEVDDADTTFGIRTVSVDPRRGLRINGETVKLRGACIHHDNGVLGAATFGRADERRVELLKDAGFNALRSAHHPMGRALLDACDRVGMLVMDEAFDMWVEAKRGHDYALRFPTWWERDLDVMVTKDLNHPSVVLYSIGNEIIETGNVTGAMQGRAMAERIRDIDPTRPITNGVNLFLNYVAHPTDTGTGGPSGLLNALMGRDDGVDLSHEDAAMEQTVESFAVLDVAGYNYTDSRYVGDGKLFPNRVIVGSESFPRPIDQLWRLVLDNDHVIGDFTWTGWDYLGEVGIGRIEYDNDPEPPAQTFQAPYPWRYAAVGDLDVTGRRLPVSYFREIVFGRRADPFIAVQPPDQHGAAKRYDSLWAWSSATASWTWDGAEGRPITVEVYAAGDEVELLQDSISLGRRPAGDAHRYLATFETA
jgi:beta-galactosidase